MLQQFYPRATLDSLANSATKELLPAIREVSTRDIFQEEEEAEKEVSRGSSYTSKLTFQSHGVSLGSQSSHLEVDP